MKGYKLVVEKSRLNLRKRSLEQTNFGMAEEQKPRCDLRQRQRGSRDGVPASPGMVRGHLLIHA